jgi:hypothetical protein
VKNKSISCHVLKTILQIDHLIVSLDLFFLQMILLCDLAFAKLDCGSTNLCRDHENLHIWGEIHIATLHWSFTVFGSKISFIIIDLY